MNFMPPVKRTILAPTDGWCEGTFYIVEAAFGLRNPIYRYIFYTGFLNGAEYKNGQVVGPPIPGGYNLFLNMEDHLEFKDAHYLRPLHKIAEERLNDGASTFDDKYNLEPKYNAYRKEHDE